MERIIRQIKFFNFYQILISTTGWTGEQQNSSINPYSILVNRFVDFLSGKIILLIKKFGLN